MPREPGSSHGKKVHVRKRFRFASTTAKTHRTISVNLTSCLVESSRETRIRALCAKASVTTDISEVDAALAELRAELHRTLRSLEPRLGRTCRF